MKDEIPETMQKESDESLVDTTGFKKNILIKK